MPTLDDLLDPKVRSAQACSGLSPSELVAAFQVLEQASDNINKQVLWCRVCSGGAHLLLQTGVIHGPLNGYGNYVLLEKTGTTWKIAETSLWLS